MKIRNVPATALWVLLPLIAPIQSVQALGKSPYRAPTGDIPASHSVAGFEVPANNQAFHNYTVWDHSKLPAFLQVAHCTGMALFARQVFNWARFDPTLPRASDDEYRLLLRHVFRVPTTALPGTRDRIVIPGFASWYEMTQQPDIEEIVKDILGDALGDPLRRNWNWSPLDVLVGFRERTLIELNIRKMVSLDRVVTLYLTDGTKTAHSVLAYGYEVLGDRVRYTVYDSNHPTEPVQMDFVFATAKFDHPDLGARDPWILHPYGDEFDLLSIYLQNAR
jgi:hypothetical protein